MRRLLTLLFLTGVLTVPLLALETYHYSNFSYLGENSWYHVHYAGISDGYTISNLRGRMNIRELYSSYVYDTPPDSTLWAAGNWTRSACGPDGENQWIRVESDVSGLVPGSYMDQELFYCGTEEDH